MLSQLIQRNAYNILKTGSVFLLSSLASQALRETSNETMRDLSKDIRQVKIEIKERKLQQKSTEEPI